MTFTFTATYPPDKGSTAITCITGVVKALSPDDATSIVRGELPGIQRVSVEPVFGFRVLTRDVVMVRQEDGRVQRG